MASFDASLPHWRTFNGNVIREHADYLELKEIRQVYGKAPKWLTERVEAARRHD